MGIGGVGITGEGFYQGPEIDGKKIIRPRWDTVERGVATILNNKLMAAGLGKLDEKTTILVLNELSKSNIVSRKEIQSLLSPYNWSHNDKDVKDGGGFELDITNKDVKDALDKVDSAFQAWIKNNQSKK